MCIRDRDSPRRPQTAPESPRKAQTAPDGSRQSQTAPRQPQTAPDVPRRLQPAPDEPNRHQCLQKSKDASLKIKMCLQKSRRVFKNRIVSSKIEMCPGPSKSVRERPEACGKYMTVQRRPALSRSFQERPRISIRVSEALRASRIIQGRQGTSRSDQEGPGASWGIQESPRASGNVQERPGARLNREAQRPPESSHSKRWAKSTRQKSFTREPSNEPGSKERAPRALETANYAQSQDASSLRALRNYCLLYTSPSPRDATLSRMPSSA